LTLVEWTEPIGTDEVVCEACKSGNHTFDDVPEGQGGE
jgi:hypothetical protein